MNTQNKIQIPLSIKLIFALVLAFCSLFIFQNSSNALSIGSQYSQVVASGSFAPNYNNSSTQYNYDGKILPYCILGYPGNETFCIYVGIHMYDNELYNIDYKIELAEKTAKIYKGNGTSLLKTTTSDINAAILAIACMNDDGSSQSSGVYSTKQYGFWTYFPQFNNENGLGLKSQGWSNGYSQADMGTNKIPAAKAVVNQYLAELEEGHDIVMKDNTDREKINIETVTIDNKVYVKTRPYNFTYNGTLDGLEVTDQDSKQISYLVGTYQGNDLKTASEISSIKSGTDFYILVSGDGDVSSINVTLKNKIDYTDKTATIWVITKDNGKTGQNLITLTYNNQNKTNNGSATIEKIDLLTDLHIEKVNADNTDFKLPKNVKFIIQNTKTEQYIALDGAPEGLNSNKDGDKTYSVKYVDSKDSAYVFNTNDTSKVDVYDVIIGEYKFYELENENYGYEENPNLDAIVLTADKDAVYQIKNKQIWVKLSGYVWHDMSSGKDSSRNDLYKDNDYDSEDELLNGIEVRLKDRTTGETVMTTKTRPDKFADGCYLFEDVEIEKLKDYYIEFEYDGLVYTNVVSHIDVDNGSKAAESEENRENFNKQFGEVLHKEEEDPMANKGYTKGVDDVAGIDQLNYTWDISESLGVRSILKQEDNYFPITADTDQTGYIIWNHFTYGMEEIQYINLGLYTRDQPYMALVKTLESAMLTINDYSNLYIYSNYSVNKNLEENAINLGVKFTSRYDQSKILQPIYHADAVEKIEDTGKELHAYVTYAIKVINQSTILDQQINQIVDYFDTRYLKDVVTVGKTYDAQTGKVSDNLKYEISQYNDSYYKMIIDTNMYLNASNGDTANFDTIYVTLSIDREGIQDICDYNNQTNAKKLLNNVAEIYNYSTYYDNKIYAGIDANSAPGNAIPGDADTYEVDTGEAPAYELEYRDDDEKYSRKVTGIVFEDYALSTTNGDAGLELLGNGIYDDNEPGIADVDVELQVYNSGTQSWETAKVYQKQADGTYTQVDGVTKTGSDGKFEIVGFIPDEYRIIYKWGDETYVGNIVDEDGNAAYTKYSPFYFKSTITPKWEEFEANYRYNWYKQETETRYNDGQDLEEYIAKLSNLLGDKQYVYGNTVDYKDNTMNFEMNSATLSFKAGIEQGDDSDNYIFITDSKEDKLVHTVYNVENIDFGVIEKGKTRLDIKKTIDSFELILSNGTTYATGTIDENGNITGSANGVSFIPSTETTSNKVLGKLNIQLDEELILGATLKVKYKFEVINNSSLIYNTLDYYYYGTKGTQADIVKLSPGMIVDYLDKDWTFDQDNDNDNWTQITKDELENMKLNGTYSYINEDVLNSAEMDEVFILKNISLASMYLAPLETTTTYLNTQAKLTNSGTMEYSNSTNILEVDVSANNSISLVNTNTGNDITTATVTETSDDETVRTATTISNTSLNLAVYAPPVKKPGNYTPRTITTLAGDIGFASEDVSVFPPTGSGVDYIQWVVIGIVSLVVIGSGLLFIKKLNSPDDKN